jgi:MFS family permease
MANGASFAAVLVALVAMRGSELRQAPPRGARGRLAEGVAYVWRRPELRAAFAMVFLTGTFAMNFPIFIPTMAVSAFRVGASGYGLLSSAMAVGAVVGAALAAGVERPKLSLLVVAAGGLGVGLVIAAVLPTFASFGACLVVLGIVSQVFSTSGNGFVQTSTEPALRGRVVALLLVAYQGGAPIGAPLIGWIAKFAGPRWGLGAGRFQRWPQRSSGVSACCPAAEALKARRERRGPRQVRSRSELFAASSLVTGGRRSSVGAAAATPTGETSGRAASLLRG